MLGFLAEALTWQDNYHIALAVDTAMRLQKPPTEFIIYGRNSGNWSGVDKKLAIAHTIMQNEVCKGCGHPTWVCRNTSNQVDFSVRTGICYATAKETKFTERKQRQKGAKDVPGQYLYTVPIMVDGSDLKQGMRAEYYESLAEDS